MENQFQENSNKKRVNKTQDFLFGILGGTGYAILSGALLVSINNFSFLLYSLFALYVIVILLLFYIKRPYLSLGIITILAVPLTILGGCMLMFS